MLIETIWNIKEQHKKNYFFPFFWSLLIITEWTWILLFSYFMETQTTIRLFSIKEVES